MRTKLSLFLGVAMFLAVFNFAQAVDIKGNDLEIILDVSGSMAQSMEGKTKIQVAKESLNSVVGSIPDGSFVGFRAYGHRNPTSDKAGSCKDSELIYPIGAINKSQMLSKINSLTPKGWTPIDYTLRQSQNDFSSKSEYGKMIILVSDGEETCGGDPCQAVKDMIASGFKVTVNTVGFDVDAKAEAQLKCIAAATGGEYKSAKNAAELTESMRVFSSRAFQDFKTSGGIAPGSGFVDAPLVSPGSFGGDILAGENKFYKLSVKKGQQITAAMNLKRDQQSPSSVGKIWLYGCNFFSPSVIVYDEFKSIVGQSKETKTWDNTIKNDDVDVHSYKAQWTADRTGTVYVSFGNSWKEACTARDDILQKNTIAEAEAAREKYNKALYDATIAVEGQGDSSDLASGAGSKEDSSGTVTDNVSGIVAKQVANSIDWGKWLIIGIVVIVLGGGGVAYLIYMINKRRGTINSMAEQGSIMNQSSSGEQNETSQESNNSSNIPPTANGPMV